MFLGHPKRLLRMPEVVVFRDDFGGRHHRDRHIGHVAFQSHQRLGTRQAGLIDGAVIAANFHEPGALGWLATVDNGSGAGFLGGQGLLITAGTFGRVRPDRSPGTGMGLGVPDRLGAFVAVVDGAVGVPRCHCVDDLPIGENRLSAVDGGLVLSDIVSCR